MKKSLGAKTIAYPTPVFIVGTYDSEGKPNMMNAAWGGICCSNPPCLTVSLRKATYSYGNILERKAFSVSIPSEAYLKEADFVGIASGRDVNKFDATGLTAEKCNFIDAPFVREFSVVIECSLVHVYDLGLHTMFVGEIADVRADESVIGSDGKVDVAKLRPFWFAPDSRRYYGTGEYLGDAFSIGKAIKGDRCPIL